MVTNQIVDHIYQAHGQRLTQCNNLLLNPAALQRYADSIARKDVHLRTVLGLRTEPLAQSAGRARTRLLFTMATRESMRSSLNQ